MTSVVNVDSGRLAIMMYYQRSSQRGFNFASDPPPRSLIRKADYSGQLHLWAIYNRVAFDERVQLSP
jgi:hypothetical protein